MNSGVVILEVATARAAGDARRMLSHELDRWSCGQVDDALLVFSELVTNAVMHAGGARHVVVSHGEQMLRIEVHDDLHDVPHVRSSPDSCGGFGLHIVAQLSRSWGSSSTDDGKVVWSEVDCCSGG